MRVILALEGIPGAGKTSCFSLLLDRFFSKVIFLSEINPEPKDFWINADSIIQGNHFDRLWVERGDLLSRSSYSFFLDRSYLSNLAYWYATDGLLGTSHYQKRKEFVLRRFRKDFLNTVVVLTCQIPISIARRKKANSSANPPWNDEIFLQYFMDFYRRELPTFVAADALFFDTSQFSSLEIADKIQKQIGLFGQACIQERAPLNLQETFDAFASENCLGPALTKIYPVLERPTIYYRQHSLQYDDGKVVYFNNEQLKRRLYATI